MHQDFSVGDDVEVTLKGKIYEYSRPSYGGHDYNDDVSLNHVAVSARGFIHHVHKSSPDIVKVAPPRPAMELGQVWIVGTDQGNRTFLVYSDDVANENLLLIGVRDNDLLKLIYSEAEFFKKYPGASLATVTV